MTLVRLSEVEVGGGEGSDRLGEEVVAGVGVGKGGGGGELAAALDRVADGRMRKRAVGLEGIRTRERKGEERGRRRAGRWERRKRRAPFRLSTVTSPTFFLP